MRTVVFHSYKGGTGKTSLAFNLAVLLATKKKKSAFIDFDLRAPSLQAYAPPPAKLTYFTDFLLDERNDNSFFYFPSLNIDIKDRLLLSYASHEFLKQHSEKRAKISAKNAPILSKLFRAAQILEERGTQYLIVDNMPGVSYRSLDALIFSTHVVCVTRPSKSEITGLSQMAENVYKPLSEESKIGLVINQIENQSTSNDRAGISDIRAIQSDLNEMRDLIESVSNQFKFPILAEIPRIPFLTERIYVGEGEKRLRPLLAALKSIHQWIDKKPG